jgi:hypothetical protein
MPFLSLDTSNVLNTSGVPLLILSIQLPLIVCIAEIFCSFSMVALVFGTMILLLLLFYVVVVLAAFKCKFVEVNDGTVSVPISLLGIGIKIIPLAEKESKGAYTFEM